MSNWGQGDVGAQALSCCVKQVGAFTAFHIYNWCQTRSVVSRPGETRKKWGWYLCFGWWMEGLLRFTSEQNLKKGDILCSLSDSVYFELLLATCFNAQKTHAKCCSSVLPPPPPPVRLLWLVSSHTPDPAQQGSCAKPILMCQTNRWT